MEAILAPVTTRELNSQGKEISSLGGAGRLRSGPEAPRARREPQDPRPRPSPSNMNAHVNGDADAHANAPHLTQPLPGV